MLRFVYKIVIVIVLIGILMIYWFYYNVFSAGERKGTLVKMTKKGNVFKTVEGEMWLSCRQVVNADKFYFSVDDEAVADSLMHLQDECIQVTYKQYRRKLAWRGDSEYLVIGFQRVR